MMFTLRPATGLDIDSLSAMDQLAQTDAHRREFITRSVTTGCGSVAVAADGQPAGYGVLEYTFYENGFVSLIYIAPVHRRQGAGRLLMRYLESICRTPKLFTFTNLSNLPMQSLLANLDYRLSGVIHDLDVGDPELAYVKYLRAGEGPRRPGF